MDNEAVRIARHYYFGSSTITADLAEAIRVYGEQCRRAGAEAMREEIATAMQDLVEGFAPNSKSKEYMATVREIAGTLIRVARKATLPSAAEAASPAAGWRTDMDAAPKDPGTELLVWDTSEVPCVAIGMWSGYWSDQDGLALHPTHWMPLPGAPSEEARAG